MRTREKPETFRVYLNSRPELLAEWHFTLNEGVDPSTVPLYSSYYRYWWFCENGHVWQATPRTRVTGHGCHVCTGRTVVLETSLRTTHPALANEWHSTKNGDRTPEKVSHGSNYCAWWTCSTCAHEWKAKVSGRSRGNGCPVCRDKKRTRLRTPYGRSLEQKILDYKRASERRGYEWKLTNEEARTLMIDACVYCGVTAEPPTRFNGLDRRDNTLDYTNDNTVTCCKPCNLAKHTMTEREFYDWLDRLARHQGYTR